MLSGDPSDPKPMASAPVVPKSRAAHDALRAKYSHEMPEELTESVGRVIIRIVPLLYGGMFGGLTHDLPLALSLGAVVSAGMDIAMGDNSFLRAIGRAMIRDRRCDIRRA